MPSPPKPHAAIDFFQRKQVVESESWDDLKWGEHSHAFTVAHSAGAGIVEDIFSILAEAQDTGQSHEETMRQTKILMAQKGWYGRTDIDPNALDADGNPDLKRRKKAKNYINWRIKVIYTQNQLTAYSAGTTRRLWQTQDIYPYWRYKQRQRQNKRPSHSAYHNMVLPADSPEWASLTPPNGWRCACYRQPVTAAEAQAAGLKIGLPDKPPAIDPTWAYDPAREALAPNWQSYNYLCKTGALPNIITNYRDNLAQAQMSKGEWRSYSERVLTGQSSPNKNAPIHLATLDQAVTGSLGFDPKLMATDKAIAHAGRGRTQNGKPRPERDLSLPQIADMPGKLANPEAIYRDRNEWLFVYKLDKEFEARVIFRQNGKRPLQLLSYTKTTAGNTASQHSNNAVYKK